MRTLRVLLVAAVATLLVLPAQAFVTNSILRSENTAGHTYDFTSSDAAGVYGLGQAPPVFRWGISGAVAFDALLYACDVGDSDSDGTLSDETNCELVSALTGSGTDFTAKRSLFVEIDTAESSGNTARLTIKGSYDQISATGTTGTEETLEYILGLDQLPDAALTYTGGRKDYFFSQGTGGLIPTTGNDANPGTWSQPKLQCDEMLRLVDQVEGVRIWVDGGDGDWVDGGASGNCIGMLDGMTPFCDSTKGACAAISALDPNAPFTIDATGATAGESAFSCDSAVADSSLILQNIALHTAVGIEGIELAKDCNVLAVNPDITITGNGTDFAVQSQGSGGVWIVGRRARLELTSASTGANNWLITTGTATGVGNAVKDAFVGWISPGVLQMDGATATDIVEFAAASNGDGLIIGAELRSSTGTSVNNGILFSQNGSNELQRMEMARVSIFGDGVAASAGIRTTTNANDEGVIINAYQTTIDGFVQGVWLVGGSATTGSTHRFRCVDCLIDNVTAESLRHDGTGEADHYIEFQGVVDEDDVTVTWEIQDTDYNTTALAQAGYDSTINFLLTNSYSGDLGGTGAACGYRETTCGGGNVTEEGICNQARECRTIAPTGSYYLPIHDDFGLRYVVPGVTLTGFVLDRGHIGAH